jgi:hypothetical protein
MGIRDPAGNFDDDIGCNGMIVFTNLILHPPALAFLVAAA